MPGFADKVYHQLNLDHAQIPDEFMCVCMRASPCSCPLTRIPRRASAVWTCQLATP